MKNKPKINWQGHRGARGLLPENTIPSFKKALDLGVNTLELDVAISADNQLIVSHEPWMSAEICLDKNGKELTEEEGKALRIFEMDYEKIKLYDCGTKVHPRFLEQEKMKVHKPSFKDMVNEIERYAKEKKYPKFFYNIEIKSEAKYDGILTPEISKFVYLTIKEITDLRIKTRVNLQSFDLRALEEIKKQAPRIKVAYLVEENENIIENLAKLSFKPNIYSPDFNLLTQEAVQIAKQKSIQVIPWTVNKIEDMQRMIELGVDGIITDFPNLKF